MLYAFARFYNSSFERAPGLTLALTNGALSGVADVVVRPDRALSARRAHSALVHPDTDDRSSSIQAQSTQIFVSLPAS
jgi:hypothetical protein